MEDEIKSVFSTGSRHISFWDMLSSVPIYPICSTESAESELDEATAKKFYDMTSEVQALASQKVADTGGEDDLFDDLM